tara:strand:- start:274 stop:393 length:120 start_codon:yes stop_codon:yes gene_type:complete
MSHNGNDQLYEMYYEAGMDDGMTEEQAIRYAEEMLELLS